MAPGTARPAVGKRHRRYRSAMTIGESGRAPADPTISWPLGPVGFRALELHEARAHGRGPRTVRDLGDAILLHDPLEPDPFLNRLSGLRLPSEADAFDRRFAELLSLFASLDRHPHILLSPRFQAPPDLRQRLLNEGFVDVGGTYAMARFAAAVQPAPRLPDGAYLEWLSTAGGRRQTVVRAAALVMSESFNVEPAAVQRQIADDLESTVAPWDVCVLFIGDEPVSAGRRFTTDGLTYLSSIGTRRSWWGHGCGAAITAALVESGMRTGGNLVHLDVEWQNARAMRMYWRLGFEIVGGRIADLLLR